MSSTDSVTSDIVAIDQLLARYNQCIDYGNPDGFAACFTAEGVLDIPGMPAEGTDALREFCAGVPMMMPGLRHWTSNHQIDVSGDTATAYVHLLMVVVGAEGTTILGHGRYTDQLVRTSDGWRYARREVLTEPAPA